VSILTDLRLAGRGAGFLACTAGTLAGLELSSLGADSAGKAAALARWSSRWARVVVPLCGLELVRVGALEPGAAADLVILDYPAATPVIGATLAEHLALGLSPAHVDAVMVDGLWRLWAHEVLSFDEAELRAKAQVAARKLWGRMKEL